MSRLVAVVDDEPDIVELVSIHLKKALFEVKEFFDAESFLRFIYSTRKLPDLVILDLMLPDMDGLEVCRHLREKEKFFSVSIIMLTAKSEEEDKIIGLELGADDYITKPFSPRELVARVKAVLRRRDKERMKGKKIEIGNIMIIDPETYEVFVEGKKVKLTNSEFKILQLLSSEKGKVFSRSEILNYLWEGEKFVLDRTVDVHIKNLRGKLGRAAKFIKNVRGVGYRLEDEENIF
ncbi:MAG TPA: response regulator transcription factor [Candidatus Aerophobetes bacterium]|uniref:Response regulator transcription factor n=1 Tax=Aerophobetes bacterium TaxID=2030807 RepID=A0A7V5I080_UNCAE|nr:response regulator transcription factor [Candidatus Aerophobetes bacterium]